MRRWIDLAEQSLSERIEGDYTGDEHLYHGTDFLGLALIIASNYMAPSIDSDWDAAHRGVSLTDNPKIAWSFASRASQIFDDNHNSGANYHGESPPGGVICLNANSLRKDYRLVHYVDSLTFDDGPGDEDEIRVLVGKRLENLSQHLEYFSFHPGSEEWFCQYLSLPEVAREYTNPQALIQTIRNLHRHPRFKPAGPGLSKQPAFITETSEGPRATVWHGTESLDIEQFTTDRDSRGRISTDTRKCISFSTDRKWAASYAGKRGVVYECSVPTHDLGDFRNPEHVEMVTKLICEDLYRSLKGYQAQHPDGWTDEKIAARLESTEAGIRNGEYMYWERPHMWAKLGWRGAWMRERNFNRMEAVNLAVQDGTGIVILNKLDPEDC